MYQNKVTVSHATIRNCKMPQWYFVFFLLKNLYRDSFSYCLIFYYYWFITNIFCHCLGPSLYRVSRLRVVPHFSSGIVERAKRLPAACRLFSRGVSCTRARVSLALLSLRKNGGLLVVYRGSRTVLNFFYLYFKRWRGPLSHN